MLSKKYFLLAALLLPNPSYSQYIDARTLEESCISGSLDNLASERDQEKATNMLKDLGFCMGYLASALDSIPLACAAAGQKHIPFDHELTLEQAREAFLEYVIKIDEHDELAVPVAQMAIITKYGIPCAPL